MALLGREKDKNMDREEGRRGNGVSKRDGRKDGEKDEENVTGK